MSLFNYTSKSCKNCYKCVRECPVKAIKFSENIATVIEERCIACGRCYVVCPKNALNMYNDLTVVLDHIKGGKKLSALVDSAYLGAYENPAMFVSALKKLGFATVSEIAVGSDIITGKYIDFINENDGLDYIISSSCPSVCLYIRKYHPRLTKYLVPVVTPMTALGKAMKNAEPDSLGVYIGPCLSYRYETDAMDENASVSFHLTFKDIEKLFKFERIDMNSLEPQPPDMTPSRWGDEYSVAGDMVDPLKSAIADSGYDFIRITGLEHAKDLFRSMEKGSLKRAYIGISACNEACANGPFMPPKGDGVYARIQRIRDFAGKGWGVNESSIDSSGLELNCVHKPIPLFRGAPNKSEIEAILKNMGKTTREQELNCGACGYDSCREKAIAVYEGMAEIDMCMPHMRSKAESINSTIFFNSRNTIIIMDSQLRVTNFNPTAERVFNICSEKIVGRKISELMNDELFKACIISRKATIGRKLHLEEQDRVVLANIIYIHEEGSVLVTMQDITEDEKRKREFDELRQKTVDTTNNVIEKQMRVAQLIASLLGETTAETKVALNKLRDLVNKEEEL